MKNFFLLSVFLVAVVTNSLGSDTIFYYAANYRPVDNAAEALFMKKLEQTSRKRFKLKFFLREDNSWHQAETYIIRKITEDHHLIRIRRTLLFSDRFQRYFSRLSTGLYKFQDINKDKEMRTGSTSSKIPLNLEGEIREYYPNGEIKTIAEYENNQLVKNKNWLKDGTEYYSDIFYSVDEVPEYKLGFGSFRNHILLGLEKSGYDITQVNEKIVLGWVILENGELVGPHKVSGKLVNLPAILVKLVESLPADWSPAKLNGRIVRYYMTIPFNFTQDSKNFDNLELRDGILFWD